MKRVEEFFLALDRACPAATPATRLHIIGSTALMLQTGYERGTKDADVLETTTLSAGTRALLLSLGGPDSDLYRRHRMYVEIVGSGIPFLPMPSRYHALDALNAEMRCLSLEVLDVTDVAVAKLKPFRPHDVADIRAMIERGHVDHGAFVRRFESALDRFLGDARAAEELPRYIERFNRIERDYFDVEETAIELPEWLDR